MVTAMIAQGEEFGNAKKVAPGSSGVNRGIGTLTDTGLYG
jgi:hypothetical protein